MEKILNLSRKGSALTELIATLQRSKNEIRVALRKTPDRPTLGTNNAGAAVRTIDRAISLLHRERGNVRRALASSRPRARAAKESP